VDILKLAEVFLKQYPELSYSIDGRDITVACPHENGFSVRLTVDPLQIKVGFDEWHEHFDLEEEVEAFNWFAWGLSDQCRLIVSKSGDTRVRWEVEQFSEEEWKSISVIGRIFETKNVEYLQNSIISESSDSELYDFGPNSTAEGKLYFVERVLYDTRFFREIPSVHASSKEWRPFIAKLTLLPQGDWRRSESHKLLQNALIYRKRQGKYITEAELIRPVDYILFAAIMAIIILPIIGIIFLVLLIF
jgi:hypothetical protein